MSLNISGGLSKIKVASSYRSFTEEESMGILCKRNDYELRGYDDAYYAPVSQEDGYSRKSSVE